MKISVSPVGVFLREEVCAVSDHLAAISLFNSERWMECLADFEGWTSRDHEPVLRELIRRMKLRPIDEPGDVDSPLLRSQIDEQFLRAMAAARETVASSVPTQMKNLNAVKSFAEPQSVDTDVTAQTSHHGLPLHPTVRLCEDIVGFVISCSILFDSFAGFQRHVGTSIASQMTSPDRKSRIRSNASSRSFHTNHAQSTEGGGSSSSTGAPYAYHNRQWWGSGWAPHFAVCDENTSVHSALSGDSYPYAYPPPHYDPNFHGMFTMPYFHPQAHEHANGHCYPPSPHFYSQGSEPTPHSEHVLAANSGWYGFDPNSVYCNSPMRPSHPPQDATDQTGLSPSVGGAPIEPNTPHQGEYSGHQMSPFWSHMDYQMHQTLTHAGIMTPHKGPVPSTPRRAKNENGREDRDCDVEAQPLLFNHNFSYYPYGPIYGESYVPPSPATQFMMSPQANAHAAAYYAAYNQGAFHSPVRSGRRRSKRGSPPHIHKKQGGQVIPPPVVRKIAEEAPKPEDSSDSELTAATLAESESVDV